MFGARPGRTMRALRGDAVLTEDIGQVGGHGMIVVGYDDTRKAFRIQNSWGRNWADGGYGWFGYEFWRGLTQVGFVID
jgi:C1A family cysteine protease